MSFRRHLVATALLAGSLASGCGAATIRTGEVPTSIRQFDQMLQGRWSLIDQAGTPVGSVEIRGDRASIVSTPDDTTFYGRITLEQLAISEFLLVLDVDSADVGAVRQLYGDVTRMPLTILFASDDIAYSLQPDGLWLRWERAL